MKFNYLKSVLLLVLLVFTGCTVQPNPYMSSAGESYTSQDIKTDFTIVKNEKFSSQKGFGIISALDNNLSKYTLISPFNVPGNNGDKLADFNLYHSVPLNDNELLKLITKVSEAIDVWDLEYPNFKGCSTAYSIIKENKTTLIFHFENSTDGAISYLKIYTGKQQINYVHDIRVKTEVMYSFNFEDKESLAAFKELLELSYKQDNFGYKKEEESNNIFSSLKTYMITN